jgi:hypothetical protein
VAALWSGVCREFARSANSLRVLVASACTFWPTGPERFSRLSHVCTSRESVSREQSAHVRTCQASFGATHLTVDDRVLCVLHRGVVDTGVHGVLCCFEVVRGEVRWCANVRSTGKTVMHSVSWGSATSEASRPTYLTLQDAVSCLLCALCQASVRGAVGLRHIAREISSSAV